MASSHRGLLELRDLRGSLPCIPLTESSQSLIDPKLIGAKSRDGKMVVVGGRVQCRERLLGSLSDVGPVHGEREGLVLTREGVQSYGSQRPSLLHHTALKYLPSCFLHS